MAFADDYVDVATRIVEFRALHPEGSLQPADPTCPYRVETFGDLTFIVYTAAAYRSPDDARPGIGIAWERVPGLTNFTKNSELQNAETSAWGRAIVAALAGDTRRSVASAEEVRNRQAEREPEGSPAEDYPYISAPNVDAVTSQCVNAGVFVADVVLLATHGDTEDPTGILKAQIPNVRDALEGLKAKDPDTLARLASLRGGMTSPSGEGEAPNGPQLALAESGSDETPEPDSAGNRRTKAAKP